MKEFLGGNILVEGKVEEGKLEIGSRKLEVEGWKFEDGDEVTILLKAEGIRKRKK